MAARIQAKILFGHVQLPKTDKLRAEAMHWACEQLNHTASSANPDKNITERNVVRNGCACQTASLPETSLLSLEAAIEVAAQSRKLLLPGAFT